jgi:hypothetical protein
MANKKISQLTAKGTALAATDLVEISESDGAGGYVTKSVTGANVVSGLQATLVSATNIKTINSNSILGSGDLVIAGGQKVPAVSNTIGTTITGLTNAISDSFLLPANTFSSNCQFELQWYPSRIVGTSGTTQGLVYINSTNSLTGATLFATGASMTLTTVTNVTCRRTLQVRSNVGTLINTATQTGSDFSSALPTENLPFDNTSGIYFLFVMNNLTNVLLQSRNVGYKLVGYNL